MQVIPDQTPLHRAAEDYYNRHGWVCMPLQADSNGLPKRPIVHDWPNIRRYMPDIDALPWGGALGLGLILGPTSSNLAVLDIDSQSLARAIYAILQSHGQPAYAVKTVRKRMHLYVTELEPTPSRKRPIKWQGDAVEIEFKAAGTQVAAPPTPGYALIEDNLHEWQSLDVFWELIDARLQYLHPLEYVPTPVNAKGPIGDRPTSDMGRNRAGRITQRHALCRGPPTPRGGHGTQRSNRHTHGANPPVLRSGTRNARPRNTSNHLKRIQKRRGEQNCRYPRPFGT